MLVDNNPRASVDNLTAAIMLAIPSASVRAALRAVLDASHVYEYVLAVGSQEQMGAVVETFTRHNLVATLRPRVESPISGG